MPAVQIKRLEQILQNMLSLTIVRSDLSDVSDTSSFKHMLAATAREIDEAYYQLTRLNDLFDLKKAAGDDLDERAKEIQPGTLRRIQALRSVGTAVFSRFNSTVGDVVIPNGTLLKSSDGKSFRTTLQGLIPDSSGSSAAIPIIALEPGTPSNVQAGTIIKFASKIPGVDAVTNPAGLLQGRDKESDDSFLGRISNYLASLSRCPVQAMEFAVIGVADATGHTVVFAHLFEDPTTLGNCVLYIDDGAGTVREVGSPIVEIVTSGLAGPPSGSAVGGEEFLYLQSHPIDIDLSPFTVSSSTRGALTLRSTVYVNPASGLLFFDPPLAASEVITVTYTPFIGLIPVVQKIIDGDIDDRVNFPGYKAGGTLVRVLAPDVVEVQVEAFLSLAIGSDRTTILANVDSAIQNYINNLGISGDVVQSKLIEVIMEVTGVIDVNVTIPDSNVIVLDNQIPRITSDNISLT